MSPVVTVLAALSALALVAIVLAFRRPPKATERPTLPPVLPAPRSSDQEARLVEKTVAIRQEAENDTQEVIVLQQNQSEKMIQDPDELNRFLKETGKSLHGDPER